jgi:hypothetical protein
VSNGATSGSIVGRLGKLDCWVLVVEMMTVIDVMKCNRSGGEKLKISRMSGLKGGSRVESVDKDRRSTYYSVSEAVESLVPWGMLKISIEPLNDTTSQETRIVQEIHMEA